LSRQLELFRDHPQVAQFNRRTPGEPRQADMQICANQPDSPARPEGETRLREMPSSQTQRLLTANGWILCAIPIGCGLLLRSFRLGDISYWFDESFSWKLATFPVNELLQRVGGDYHPPLFFLVLKAWASIFGDSPVALRSLSVLCGSLAILGTYLMVREAYRPRDAHQLLKVGDSRRGTEVALLAAGLVATSEVQILWSTQVRMYALATALATLSTWTLLLALHSRAVRRGAWLAYVCAAVAFLHTHYYAIFSVAAQFVFAAGVLVVESQRNWRSLLRDQRLLAWLVSLWLIGSLCSLWLPVFLDQRQQAQTSFWIGSLDWHRVAGSLVELFAPGSAGVDFFVTESVGALSNAESAAVFGIFAVLAAGLAWRARAGDWLLLLSGFGPFLMAIAVSEWDTKVFFARYLISAHLFLLAGIASLVGRIPSTGLRRATSLLLIAQFLWLDVGYLSRRAQLAEYPGAHGAVEYIDRERQPGEIVVSPCPMLTPTLEAHSRSRRGWQTLHGGYGFARAGGTAIVREGESISIEELNSVVANRVWVVEEVNWRFGNWTVDIPAHWGVGPAEQFGDVYGPGNTVVVRQFYPSNEKRDRQTSITPSSN
jgi:mannosyltransferase